MTKAEQATQNARWRAEVVATYPDAVITGEGRWLVLVQRADGKIVEVQMYEYPVRRPLGSTHNPRARGRAPPQGKTQERSKSP